MSEREPNEANDAEGDPRGEEPRKSEEDSWDRTIAPTLWFVTTYVVAGQIAKTWLAEYLALGIGWFIAVLVVFRFGGPRYRRYGLLKSTALALLSATTVALLVLAWSALSSVLVKR